LWCKPQRKVFSKTPADFGLSAEVVQFLSRGILLKGWFVPPATKSPPPPAVLLVHGWSGNAATMLPIAGSLQKAGFGVFLFDARGHGASGKAGPITILKFAEDMIAALNVLESRPEVDKDRLGVVGFSMGGSAAILAASKAAAIKTVVSLSAFADPVEITRDYLKEKHIPRRPFLGLMMNFIAKWLGVSVREVTPRNLIGRIRAPLLLVHGEADRYLSFANMETLFSQADPERAEKRLCPTCGHFEVIKDPECIEAMNSFLRKHLTRVS